MADRTLVEFVKEALMRGATREDIERTLTEAGWSADQVKSALAAYSDAAFVVPVPRPSRYVSAREAFLYLVLFIVLGVVATHLGALLFTLIDVFLPRDTAPTFFDAQRASGAIRWAVSALTVGLPVLLLLSWRLGRARRRNPAMQGSRIRKWLTYITLVIAAATLIGDLIAVVYSLLSGDLSLRFVLKAGVIAAIAGVIFTYYVRDAERDEESAWTPLDLGIGGGVTAAALAASIAGVAVIDSPAALRERERDNARLAAIVDIAGAVDCYYTYEGATPESLEEMRADLAERASRTPLEYACEWGERTDPATGAPYEYQSLSGSSYEVCAVFDRATDDDDPRPTRSYSYSRRPDRGPRSFNAVHGEGRHCWTLEAESLAEDE